jgi:hypothetical protein
VPKIYDGEETASSTNVTGKSGYPSARNKLDPCLSPCTSTTQNGSRDLNIRPKTLKLVQEGTGNTLELIGIGKDFLNRTPVVQQLRERMENETS